MSDLIKRSDAINAIEHYIDEVRNIPMGTSFKSGVKDGYYRAISIIKRLPSAERTGHWIEKEDPYGFFNSIPVCSECGCTTKMREKTNYCPTCGADMRGEKDEID